MRIESWTVDNFMGIRHATVRVDGNAVIIGGRNAQGKTSLLDALMVAFLGKTSMPAEPVRKGEPNAKIVVETDEVTITRRIKPDGSGDVKVTTKEGFQRPAAQEWLNSQLGKIGFDPMLFVRLDDDKQADMLRKLVGVEVGDLDSEYKIVYEKRRDKGRDRDRVGGALGALPSFEDAPETEPSVADLIMQLNEASQNKNSRLRIQAAIDSDRKNLALLEQKAERASASVIEIRGSLPDLLAAEEKAFNEGQKFHASAEAEADRTLEEELARARAKHAASLKAISDAKARDAAQYNRRRDEIAQSVNDRADLTVATANSARAEADALIDKIAKAIELLEGIPEVSVDDIQFQIKDMEDLTRKFKANQEHKRVKAEYDQLHGEYEAMTKRLGEITDERSKRITSAKYPIPGLGFNADGAVTFNGIPLSQSSMAQKIKVSMAIGIALCKNIPVVLIRDASLLDEDSMQSVIQMAAMSDALVVLERVGSNDAMAIIIEDGEIVS